MPADVSTGVETPEEQHLREATRVFVLRHQHSTPTAVSSHQQNRNLHETHQPSSSPVLRNMVGGGGHNITSEYNFPAQMERDSSIEFVTEAHSPPLSRDADFKISTLTLHAPNSYLENRTKG